MTPSKVLLPLAGGPDEGDELAAANGDEGALQDLDLLPPE